MGKRHVERLADWWEENSLIVKLPLAVMAFFAGLYFMFHDVM